MPDLDASADPRRLDPARLNTLLRERHPDVDVTGVEILDQTDGSASRLRLRLTYAPGHDAGLPENVFVKRNLTSFNFPSEMYSTEVRVYRDVLPTIAVEKPAVYAIDSELDDVTFTIVMEDLSTRPGGRLGIVTEPVTPQEVAGLLSTMATIHAAWWDDQRLADELPWATPPHQNAPMQFWRKIGPKLASRHMERGHRAEVVDRRVWTDAALWGGFDRLIDAMSDGPHTLLHGDVHAGNVYYVAGQHGGLIDWQLALRGCWALDVTYLLTTALDPEQRAEHERSLIEGYLAELAVHGVPAPSFDEAWLQYRRHALYGVLMWIITPDGVHTDEAQLGYLERCLAAAEALDTKGALEV
jgi:aminoglycoside phosphotransferase (APT) family kinase protein